MTEQVLGPSGVGTVVLDLGAGIGALILYTPAGLDGQEIEISRPGEKRTHSRVRRRDTAAGTRYAAVYPGLPAGDYAIWREDDSQAATATITGGSVTSCRWPDLP
jgi:hypothetical protein